MIYFFIGLSVFLWVIGAFMYQTHFMASQPERYINLRKQRFARRAMLTVALCWPFLQVGALLLIIAAKIGLLKFCRKLFLKKDQLQGKQPPAQESSELESKQSVESKST